MVLTIVRAAVEYDSTSCAPDSSEPRGLRCWLPIVAVARVSEIAHFRPPVCPPYHTILHCPGADIGFQFGNVGHGGLPRVALYILIKSATHANRAAYGGNVTAEPAQILHGAMGPQSVSTGGSNNARNVIFAPP
jgi:hypothetical protein